MATSTATAVVNPPPTTTGSVAVAGSVATAGSIGVRASVVRHARGLRNVHA